MVKYWINFGQHFFHASLKRQIGLAACFFLGYFSPLIGIIGYGVIIVKKWDKEFGKWLLFGGGVALGMYLVSYSIL